MSTTAMMRTFVLRGDEQARGLWAFLKNNWRALADAGKPLAVQISPHKARRSLEQNKRYWAILNEISEHSWIDGKRFSTDAWHEKFKRHFIGLEDVPGGGIVGISTTTLDVGEFADYMNKVEAYAVDELGITP